MNRKTMTKRIISVVISAIMVLTMFPVMAFTSVAATSPANQDGVWYYLTSVLNASRTSFSTEGQNNVSMAVDGTEFYFMQTEDNQEMTYSTVFYAKKKSWNNSIVIQTVTTDLADDAYTAVFNSGSWALTTGSVANDGGDDSPNGDDMKRDGFGGLMTGWTYTSTFTANGSAVYHPQWTVVFKNSSTVITALSSAGENPTFTIQVIDLRELISLVALANERGKNISDIIDGYDLTGATYYSQETVDSLVSAVTQRLCADYTALDAAIANAEALGENTQSLGGKIYDETTYNAMAAVLAEARAIDRHLEDTAENNSMLNAKAAELQAAVDAVIRNDFEVISYYVDGVLYATSSFAADGGFNFHDVTDHFVEDPTKENATFGGWRDASGNKIAPGTPVTSSFSVYAYFIVDTRGAGPVEQYGRYDHAADANYSDGRGANGVTLWVESNNFNFVQTKDDQEFSFNAAVSAVKNDPSKFARVTQVVFADSSTAFITDNNLTNDDIVYYCETGNAGDKPADSTDGNLPGVTGATFEEQMANSEVRWRYIYTFPAQGEKHYTFDWTIKFKSGNSSSSNSTYTETVTFNINVTDLREIIKVYAKARSVANDSNSPLSPERQAELVALVNSIDENYRFDGTEYYPQTDIDALVSQLNGYIQGTDFPCDYTALDAAIALAETYDIAGNNADHHYIDEAWNDFLTAYQAATNVQRGLYIDDNNVNQPMIDAATEELEYAIEGLSYKTHQNPQADTTALEEAVDNANDVISANPDAYTPESVQALEDAIAAAEEIINNPPYDIGDGTADQIIQDAIDAINDALEGLTPDKTALEDKITEGENTDTTGMTPESIQALEDAITAAEAVDNDPDATVEEINDAIAAIEDAINGLTPDKTELEEKITEGENTDTTGMTPESIQALEDAITAAEAVDNDPDATVEEINDAIAAIEDAINGLTPDKTELEEKITEGENTDTTGMTPESIQALEDAITAGQAVDNDPDATVEEIAEATQAIIDAINSLEEIQQIIPETGSSLIVDRTDTEYYYLVGLDASDTSLANVKSLLENDGRQIIAFRGETQLTDADYIGTGCVIKCVSIADPTVVYEQATVILYGDVNGDGLINSTDYDAMFDETLFGQAIEGRLFRIAGDVNGDSVIDGFDMAKVELQMTGAKALGQDMEYYK